MYLDNLSYPFLGSATNSFGGMRRYGAVTRRVFFSFHYDDVMRVNNVRNAWRYHRSDLRQQPSFVDKSLWESKKLEAPESIKSLIRNGVHGASVVCVLVGTSTWSRRWVRYEIARSVVDGKGLLAIDLNAIRHHRTRQIDAYGPNPLDYLAVGKNESLQYHLYERKPRWNSFTREYDWTWQRYTDYQHSVDLPWYLPDPQPGYVTPLSKGASVYCYVQDFGYQNIGGWTDLAAQAVGR